MQEKKLFAQETETTFLKLEAECFTSNAVSAVGLYICLAMQWKKQIIALSNHGA